MVDRLSPIDRNLKPPQPARQNSRTAQAQYRQIDIWIILGKNGFECISTHAEGFLKAVGRKPSGESKNRFSRNFFIGEPVGKRPKLTAKAQRPPSSSARQEAPGADQPVVNNGSWCNIHSNASKLASM